MASVFYALKEINEQEEATILLVEQNARMAPWFPLRGYVLDWPTPRSKSLSGRPICRLDSGGPQRSRSVGEILTVWQTMNHKYALIWRATQWQALSKMSMSASVWAVETAP